MFQLTTDEYNALWSQIATLENENYLMSQIGTSWFAFLKMDIRVVEMLRKLEMVK